VPKVGFSLSEDLYKVLESVAKGRGISVHQLVKEIVELHVLKLTSQVNLGKLTSQVNLASLPENDPQVNLTKLTSEDSKLTSQVNLVKLTSENPRLTCEVNLSKLTSDNARLTSQVNLTKLTSANGSQDQVSDELVKRIEALEQRLDALAKDVRKLQDLTIAYTGKSDQVLQRLSQVVELLQQVAESLRQGSEKVSEERQRVSEGSRKKEARREKGSACEWLKEELAIFESDIADRIRDRDRFFTKIARVCNGIVVEGAKERVAIEKGFWQSFLDKLSKIDTSDEEKVKALLDPLEFRLFTVLKESALIIFDANERRWKPVFKPSTTNTSTSSSSTGSEGSAMATGSDTSNSAERRYRKKQYEEDESWLLQYVEIGDAEAVKH